MPRVASSSPDEDNKIFASKKNFPQFFFKYECLKTRHSFSDYMLELFSNQDRLLWSCKEIQVLLSTKNQIVKLSFSDKAAKIWSYLPLVLTFT